MSRHQRLKRTMRSPVRQARRARKGHVAGYVIYDEGMPGQTVETVRGRIRDVERIEKRAALLPRSAVDRLFLHHPRP